MRRFLYCLSVFPIHQVCTLRPTDTVVPACDRLPLGAGSSRGSSAVRTSTVFGRFPRP
jgi:hypothetical protein